MFTPLSLSLRNSLNEYRSQPSTVLVLSLSPTVTDPGSTWVPSRLTILLSTPPRTLFPVLDHTRDPYTYLQVPGETYTYVRTHTSTQPTVKESCISEEGRKAKGIKSRPLILGRRLRSQKNPYPTQGTQTLSSVVHTFTENLLPLLPLQLFSTSTSLTSTTRHPTPRSCGPDKTPDLDFQETRYYPSTPESRLRTWRRDEGSEGEVRP